MKFPKRLFVKHEEDRDTTYLVAAEDCDELAGDVGGVIPVGVYELVNTAKLATKAEFQSDKRRVKRS